MTKKPIIGIILDFKSGSPTSYSVRPHYALRTNYVEMINNAGAVAILIPYDYNAIEDYLSMIDGLLVVGGFFDINPKRYGDKEIHETIVLNETRENFEFAFATKALENGLLPILGICNGMQLINVIRGGNIMQHIADENVNFLNHEQSKVKGREDSSKAYHQVFIEDGSILQKIVGTKQIDTNSSHHQAIKNVGAGLKINAKASDGIIEGIEDDNHPFCVAVQWHPEFAVSQADGAIFTGFIEATKKYKKL